MLLITILGAVMVAAPPGNFELRDWIYPDDRVISEGKGVGGAGVGAFQRHGEMYQRVSYTKDPFEKVVEFYRKRAGLTIDNGAEDDASIIQGSRRRPLSLCIITRRYGNISMTVVVSRGEGEKWTHIAVDYKQPVK